MRKDRRTRKGSKEKGTEDEAGRGRLAEERRKRRRTKLTTRRTDKSYTHLSATTLETHLKRKGAQRERLVDRGPDTSRAGPSAGTPTEVRMQ
jgi:hypothetical protein